MNNYNILNSFFNFCLILILCQNSQADVCQTCSCSTTENRISINCRKAKFVSINVIRFGLISVKYNGTLSFLDLSENNITYLPNDMFESSMRLKVLNLSNNSVEEIHGSLFKNLNSLEILNLSSNKLQTIDLTILPTLYVMDLSNNFIKDLDFDFHKAYPQLTYLNLSHNNLDDSMNATLTLVRKLKHLDLSYNNLHLLDNEDFSLLSQLISLDISNNEIKSLSKQKFPDSLIKLNVGFNLLNTFPNNLLNIQILNIEYNQICDIQNVTNEINILKYLNVSGNLLKNLPGIKFTKLKTLDLSYNNFTTIPITLNKVNYPVLETLIFSGNLLTRIGFPSYLNLKSLIMSKMNFVKRIHKDSFKKLNYLENDCLNLTITNNEKLNVIEESALTGLNLCFLDLKNNQFTFLDSKLLNTGLKTKLGVDLEGNPFHCNCSLQWMLNDFVPWLYSKNPNLLNNLRCTTPQNLYRKRMVHWYNWRQEVFCNNNQMYSSKITNLEVLSRNNSVILHISSGMLGVLIVAVIILLLLVIIGIIFAKKIASKHTRINRRF